MTKRKIKVPTKSKKPTKRKKRTIYPPKPLKGVMIDVMGLHIIGNILKVEEI